jgi:hypothetical protein
MTIYALTEFLNGSWGSSTIQEQPRILFYLSAALPMQQVAKVLGWPYLELSMPGSA